MKHMSPREITLFNNEGSIKLGSQHILICGVTFEGAVRFKIEKTTQAFLGSSYTGSPGYDVLVGHVMPKMRGWHVADVEAIKRGSDPQHPASTLKVTLRHGRRQPRHAAPESG